MVMYMPEDMKSDFHRRLAEENANRAEQERRTCRRLIHELDVARGDDETVAKYRNELSRAEWRLNTLNAEYDGIQLSYHRWRKEEKRKKSILKLPVKPIEKMAMIRLRMNPLQAHHFCELYPIYDTEEEDEEPFYYDQDTPPDLECEVPDLIEDCEARLNACEDEELDYEAMLCVERVEAEYFGEPKK